MSKTSIREAVRESAKNLISFSEASQYTDGVPEVFSRDEAVEYLIEDAEYRLTLEGDELENALKGTPSPLTVSDADYADWTGIVAEAEAKLTALLAGRSQ